jgi:hypothetical protein
MVVGEMEAMMEKETARDAPSPANTVDPTAPTERPAPLESDTSNAGPVTSDVPPDCWLDADGRLGCSPVDGSKPTGPVPFGVPPNQSETVPPRRLGGTVATAGWEPMLPDTLGSPYDP